MQDNTPFETYEIVGNYIRQTRSDLVSFTPIFAPGNSFTFHKNPVDGMSIGGLRIRGGNPQSVAKPSYEEFKNTLIKKIESASSGGRKTRRV